LYLEDISDFIVECVDANFGFSRYAEWGEVLILLTNCMGRCNKNQLISMILLSILKERNDKTYFVLISVPFREFIQCF
jgi:hypothetical protein